MPDKWCKEHQTVWFKKGAMKGYAHPILDQDGEKTGKWCNEPEAETKKTTESPERQASIEIQNAYGNAASVVELKNRYPEDPLINAAYNYGMSKLANWSSVGEPPQKEPVPGTDEDIEKPTVEQRKRLSTALKKWDTQKAKRVLVDRWLTNDTKTLNKGQMEDFIAELNKGEDLLEPKDILF